MYEMQGTIAVDQIDRGGKQLLTRDWPILILSVFLQLALGIFFGHSYDMRIFMATGYLVSSGQNPYIAQDLTTVFQNSSFQGMTSIGYPPPWPLVLGFIYRYIYDWIPNLLLYNLAIKIPVIAANVCLAYLVADVLKNLGTQAKEVRRAWIFILLCPFILYFGSAWGQFDSIVALLSLLSIICLERGYVKSSAILLSLAIAFKPIALPIFPVAILYLIRKSSRQVISYSLWFSVSLILFCVLPFLLLRWDPTPILEGWNAHFTVGGAMSFMTFFELLADSYQLPGDWWLLGLIWIPAMLIAIYQLRHGISDFTDLVQKSLGMILIFYLTRTWLSEPNIMLILPLALILKSTGKLNNLAFYAVWIIPLIFTIFNASPPQLLAINFPLAMERFISLQEEYRSFRLVARTALIIPWQIVGWWIVITCLKDSPSNVDGARSQLLVSQA
jgi:hypothetical protein